MDTGFDLDARLVKDTASLGDWPLSRVLLMRNRLFPWLILVPRRAGAVEIHRLSPDDQGLLSREASAAARVLERLCQPDKINTGALGNVVSQLHIHVVARRRDDPAWPGPVWGCGLHTDYGLDELSALAHRLCNALHAEIPLIPEPS
ncbi:diadenosine tetraphosphate hydrolase [Niveispirillum lacus]|uniref:Diadenosine tetraphosphate hydrolase n=1 Tax=Niveispirillum lacus TaxID=1981099 RepID=A0A255YWX7_9PROT|nr:HIT family protein [Niveispirillum lacus]OYQ33712.1 diadenosine tetraphosphate hydrolase [Niveispirillum lacus]